VDRVRPTRVTVLVALAVITGGLAYLVTRSHYADFESPPRYAPLWLLLLAVAEGYTALLTRSRLAGRHATRPPNPLVIARLVVLAKASSPVGALATGAYTGFLVFVARENSSAAHSDTRTAALGIAFSLALVAAALLLERVCRVKTPPDDPTAVDN
jgi:hypothetical protein